MSPPTLTLPPGIRWDGSSPIVVERLVRMTLACPAQWEGPTADGDHVYIRERHGYLSVELSDDGDPDRSVDLLGLAVADLDLDDPAVTPWMPSWLRYDELRANVPDWLVLPDHDEGADDWDATHGPATRDQIRARIAELEAFHVRFQALLDDDPEEGGDGD